MAAADRDKALETALAQIDRQFGKGSVMRLGDEVRAPVEVIPTGSIALDVALGIGGLPRGRVGEIYGPESSGESTVAGRAGATVAGARARGRPAAQRAAGSLRWRCTPSPMRRPPAASLPSSTPRTPSTRSTPRSW